MLQYVNRFLAIHTPFLLGFPPHLIYINIWKLNHIWIKSYIFWFWSICLIVDLRLFSRLDLEFFTLQKCAVEAAGVFGPSFDLLVEIDGVERDRKRSTAHQIVGPPFARARLGQGGFAHVACRLRHSAFSNSLLLLHLWRVRCFLFGQINFLDFFVDFFVVRLLKNLQVAEAFLSSVPDLDLVLWPIQFRFV